MHVAISMPVKIREVDLGEGVAIFIHLSITLFEHTGSLRIMAHNATQVPNQHEDIFFTKKWVSSSLARCGCD